MSVKRRKKKIAWSVSKTKKNFGFGALAEIRILTHLKYCSSLNLMYFYPFPLSEEIRYGFKG
mgnify:CR=1 FL=1